MSMYNNNPVTNNPYAMSSTSKTAIPQSQPAYGSNSFAYPPTNPYLSQPGAMPMPQPNQSSSFYGAPQMPMPTQSSSFYGGPPQPAPYQSTYPPNMPPSQPYPVPVGAGSFYTPQQSVYGSQYGAPFQQQPPASIRGWITEYYQQISPQERMELERWFKAVDRDGSGSISQDELQRLSFGGKNLSAETAYYLIAIFDKDKNGTIDFFEYATMHKFLTAMQSAFFVADRDGNGTLDENEIHTALDQGGFRISPTASRAIFRRYALGSRGLTFVDFIRMIATLALLRTKFESADTDRDGRVTVDLNLLIELSGI